MSEFTDAFDSDDLAVARSDASGTFVDANQAYLRLTGYSLSELKQMTFRDITPDKWTIIENRYVIKEVFVKGRAHYDKEYITKSGEVIPITANVYLIEPEDGPKGMWGTFSHSDKSPNQK